MAIIVIFAGLTWGGLGIARDRANLDHARAELACLHAGLTGFKNHWGRFPEAQPGWGPQASARMTGCLSGELGPEGEELTGGRAWVEIEAGDSEQPLYEDPWGNPYRYAYLNGWSGVVLYSSGPDGLDEGPDENGWMDPEHPLNRDNVYAN